MTFLRSLIMANDTAAVREASEARLFGLAPRKQVSDAVDEIDVVDMRAPKAQEPHEKNDRRGRAHGGQQPKDRSACKCPNVHCHLPFASRRAMRLRASSAAGTSDLDTCRRTFRAWRSSPFDS